MNGTGISAVPLAADVYTNANETESHEGHGDNSSASATESVASATASATPTATGNYANMLTAGWGVLGAAVLGAVALL